MSAAPSSAPSSAAPNPPAGPPPLWVERFWLRGFRNLAETDLFPGRRFNVLSGDNGQGKTNLLEALFYLGALRSFRGARVEDLVQHDADVALLRGRFAGVTGLPMVATAKLERGRTRVLSLEGKRPRSTAAWVMRLPMVLFHPGHLALATGSPELRRHYLDRILEQVHPTHRKSLAAYEKALRSRNRLLKADTLDRSSLDAYADLMAVHGAVVGQARRELAQALAPRIQTAFEHVAGLDIPLAIDYQCRVEPSEEALREALLRSLNKDRARGFTADGPHSDDLVLKTHRRAARHHASQGQHRMLVLAMKMAELDALTEGAGQVPILLLDDVTSELDPTRNALLFEYLDAIGGQVFLSTTHRALIRLDGDRQDFEVRGGHVTHACAEMQGR